MEGGVQAAEGGQVEVVVWRDVKRAVKGRRDGGGRKQDDERQKEDSLQHLDPWLRGDRDCGVVI